MAVAGSLFVAGLPAAAALVEVALVRPRLLAMSLLEGPGCSSVMRSASMDFAEGGSTRNPRSSRLHEQRRIPHARINPITSVVALRISFSSKVRLAGSRER